MRGIAGAQTRRVIPLPAREVIIMVAVRSVGEEMEERDRGHLRGRHSSLEISDVIEAAGIVPQLILQLAGEGGIGGLTPQGRQ